MTKTEQRSSTRAEIGELRLLFAFVLACLAALAVGVALHSLGLGLAAFAALGCVFFCAWAICSYLEGPDAS